MKSKLPQVPWEKTKEQITQILKKEFEKPKTFIDKLRHKYDHLFKEIQNHPFLTEIETGRLPREKYKTYSIQNYCYFMNAFRNTSAFAAKAATLAETNLVSEWGKGWNPEWIAFNAIIRDFGDTEEELENAQINPGVLLPAARAYIDYSYFVYSTGSIGEAAMAVLPCAWTYSPTVVGGVDCPLRVATGLMKYYGVNKKIAMEYGNYSRQQPHLVVLKNLKDLINYEASKGDEEKIARLTDIFTRCLDYEYKWWDLAYRHDPNKPRHIASYW